VGDEEVELRLGGRGGERVHQGKGHEVPVEVGQLLREGGRELALHGPGGREGLSGAGGLELEELQDARAGLVRDVLERAGEVLEPLEVAREGIWASGQGLGVGWQRGVMVGVCLMGLAGLGARLGQEFAVLLEDLEVFLRQCRWTFI
jgi:hypothetical protein